MAEKISKTAKASMRGKAVEKYKKLCACGEVMVATKFVQPPRGMWWKCSNDHLEKC